MEFFGKAPVNKWLYTFGKISLVGVLAAPLLAQVYRPIQRYASIETLVFAAVLFIPGAIISLISMYNLGRSLRMGLPSGKTSLKTDGVYRFTRNPIYVSFALLSASSSIYTANPAVIVLSAYVIFVHHRIVLSEEKFLAKRFGRQWKEYASKVGRYF